jgi:hypothetical protein
MFVDEDEVAYVQQRITVSLDMARATTSDCARIAHQALAEGYGRHLAALKHFPDDRLSHETHLLTRVGEKRLEPLLSTS